MTTGNCYLIPSPPPKRIGWPWTKGSTPLPPVMPNGRPWPRVSIVTPSYNQGQFLEETIRSVLLQGYPNLEYIIMDGGSTDNSVDIIRKYGKYLTHWESGKDAGQADSIYRGFEMATGEIIAYINSDDYYLANAFHSVVTIFSRHTDAEFIIGGHYLVDENGKIIEKYPSFSQDFESLLLWEQHMAQMSSFWLRKTFFDVGGFDRNLHFAFDFDLMLRLTKRKEPIRCRRYLSAQRDHASTKTNTIWQKYGLPEVRHLQKFHSAKTYSLKERRVIITRSTMIFSLKQLQCIENIVIKPKKYIKDIFRSLKYFLKCIVEEI
jgi:glycosyltransferase involved in cell wall biosynthesis